MAGRFRRSGADYGFSALQRAENSSMRLQFARDSSGRPVSVLFSEPKIPQFWMRGTACMTRSSFSALQRAENSSIFT